MQISKGKKLFGAVLAVIMTLCMMTSWLPSARAASVYDECLTWSQLDSSWGSTPMGGSTIRSSGCLLTSLAIMTVRSGSIDSKALSNLGISSVEEFNPAVLANAYTRVGGFTSGGAIQSWGTIHQLVPNIEWGWDKYFTSSTKSGFISELKGLMSDGWHIIARVAAPYGGYHWVYILGVTDDTIYMCDPAKDETDLYAAYPGGLQGEYWALKGSNAPSMAAPVTYDPELNVSIASAPEKLVFRYGEALDLSDGTAAVSGVDPKSGEWAGVPELITADAESFTITTGYDPYTPGEYEVTLKASTDYAEAEISLNVVVSQPTGEYILSSSEHLDVYSAGTGGSVIMSLKKGSVVNITECYGSLGLIASDDFTGWVNVEQLTASDSGAALTPGDINNDGSIDKYDLSVLNTYLKEKAALPDGISTLTAAELAAADINSDGEVDSSDVLGLLTAIRS